MGFNIDQIRTEAAVLLDCGNTVKDKVNGLVSYGLLDETADDNTRHTLCIAGNIRQGPGKWYIPHGGIWDADTNRRLFHRVDRQGGEGRRREGCFNKLDLVSSHLASMNQCFICFRAAGSACQTNHDVTSAL